MPQVGGGGPTFTARLHTSGAPEEKNIAKYEISPPGRLLIAARWDPWRNNAKTHILWIEMRCGEAVFDVGLKNPKHRPWT